MHTSRVTTLLPFHTFQFICANTFRRSFCSHFWPTPFLFSSLSMKATFYFWFSCLHSSIQTPFCYHYHSRRYPSLGRSIKKRVIMSVFNPCFFVHLASINEEYISSPIFIPSNSLCIATGIFRSISYDKRAPSKSEGNKGRRRRDWVLWVCLQSLLLLFRQLPSFIFWIMIYLSSFIALCFTCYFGSEMARSS